jgi:hypothetical protein
MQLLMVANLDWTVHLNEHQQSVNDFESFMYGNWKVTWSLLSITNVLAAFFGQTINNTVTALF